jgi:hypothetical protein
MVVRTLEAIFHRPLRLLILFVLVPLISIGVVYFVVPHVYKSTATLWALQPFESIGLTTTASNVPVTPAQTQADALSELLQTRFFALAVVDETNLASTLDQSVQSDPQRRNDAMVQEISQHVQVQAQGTSLFVISYANRNPQVAQQVVAAVIRNYSRQIQNLFLVQSQELLSNYQTQLAQAKNDAQAAAVAESKYLLAHPDLTGNSLLSDPQYALLHAQTQQAQIKEQDIQTHLDNIEQEIAAQGITPDSLFKVVDNPVVPSLPESRSRDFIIAGGIGLCVAIIAFALHIVILVRRDHAIYAAPDLQKVMAYPVIMQVPRLTSKTVRVLVERSR